MQAHKYLLAILTISFAGQITAQVAAPKATTSTKDQAIKKTESTSTQAKDGVDKVETTVKDILGDKKESGATSNPAALFITSKTSFSLDAKDESSTIDFIEWKPKNGEYRKYTQPIRISEEGLTEVYYRSVDKVGNAETPKILVLHVDNTAPRVSLVPQEQFFVLDGVPFASKNNTYTLVAEDQQTGVEKVQFNVNQEATKVYADPIKLENGGANVVKYSATDKSGNSSPESSIIITVDDVKPTIEIVPSFPLVDINGKNFQRKGNVFYVNATDKESGIKKILVKVDEEEYKLYVEAIAIETQGDHVIKAMAVDNVGNQSDVVEVKLSVDLTPPTSTIQKSAEEPKVETPAPAATTPSK
ncbi:multi-beta-barrel domain surface protein OmpL47 [Leptospira vanthielii]|uniref:Bacterial group 3 Ig-like protein n=1 Tax=Leptospira vanthielii serovar Holland str. Waz Holland = ATCC 700522 TaxID=1218591 RepID=N1W3Y3_9LEPT|nr:hypothetical protein [Leptospira vanthielii]EMY70954.1 hypothetical protein LEP1GSC199_0273 [Leptospira vanthielii serovar Holland str. Waz Holland = ATCC 700522]